MQCKKRPKFRTFLFLFWRKKRHGLLTLGDGWPSLALKPIWDSRSRWLRPPDGESAGELGLRNLSKMAMIKNIEMRMAVATNPNDTALTELSKFLKGSSLCTLSNGAPTGTHAYPSSSTIFVFLVVFPYFFSFFFSTPKSSRLTPCLRGSSWSYQCSFWDRALDCTERCGST